MRVLLTGMSGTGKSTLVAALRARGHVAHDADDGFAAPRADGRWGWRRDAVAALLAAHEGPGPLFFAGCSEEQGTLPFDVRVVLVVPRAVLLERLATRATNAFGRDPAQRALVLADLEEVQPLLLASADLVLTTTEPAARTVDRLLAHLAGP